MNDPSETPAGIAPGHLEQPPDTSAAQAACAYSDQPPPQPIGSQRLILAGILSLMTVVAFEAFAVASAMPVVARDLGAGPNYSLAFSVFLTASLFGTVLGGGWGDAAGPRWPVVVGQLWLCGGLIVCGSATNLPVFLTGRVISGLGGGLMVVGLFLMISLTFGPAQRPKVFALLSAAWVLPSLAGPVAAGWLAEHLSWRLVFLAIVPIGAVAMAMLWVPLCRLPQQVDRSGPSRAEHRRRLSAGAVLALGAGLAQVTAQRLSPQESTGAAAVTGVAWVLTAAGVVAVFWSLPALMPPGTLRLARGLPAVVVTRGAFTGAFFAGEAFLPLALTSERGFSATQAGMVLTVSALLWAVGASIQGRVGASAGRIVIGAGGLCVAVMLMLAAAVFAFDAPSWLMPGVWALGGLGMGLSHSALSVATLELAESDQHGRAASALQIMDGLGPVAAIGVTGAVYAWLHGAGNGSSVFAGMWAALALLAAAASGFAVRRIALPQTQPEQPA
ncbi:MAG: MFS transporter [Micrococcales bacterium]|nr:MAG: MFS transporter [Micrococcales bacterium]